MYKLLRNLHLALGLFACIPLLAYGLSAAQMAYPIYHWKSVETTVSIDVPAGVDARPRALAQWLMDTRGLAGELTDVSAGGGVVMLSITHPGTNHRVRYDPDTRSAEITTERLDAVGMLNRLHHAAGVSHADGATNAWGWFLLAVSVALLLLATSGVVMWFSRHDEVWVGAFVLTAGLLWGGTLLFLIRTA